MLQVNIKRFQREFYAFMGQMPLIITKAGKPFAKVIPYDENRYAMELKKMKSWICPHKYPYEICFECNPDLYAEAKRIVETD